MTNEKQQPGGEPSGQDLVEQLKASGRAHRTHHQQHFATCATDESI
ncbi:MAG: hypothetical protein ACTH6N_11225 [Brachybacterium tyrofermentans]|nr:hypothetical protein [Brachybacterium tyrofermentans]